MKKKTLPAGFDTRGITVLALTLLLAACCYVGLTRNPARVTSVPVTCVTPKATGATGAAGAAEKTAASPTPSPTAAGAFSAYRTQLDETRAQAFAALRDIVDDPDADAATVSQARAQQVELARTAELEQTLEAVLQAAGFPETLVTVRKGSVNIVVRKASLSQEEAAQILSLAVRETGENANNIQIIAAK